MAFLLFSLCGYGVMFSKNTSKLYGKFVPKMRKVMGRFVMCESGDRLPYSYLLLAAPFFRSVCLRCCIKDI
jgi:hypothetical protein